MDIGGLLRPTDGGENPRACAACDNSRLELTMQSRPAACLPPAEHEHHFRKRLGRASDCHSGSVTCAVLLMILLCSPAFCQQNVAANSACPESEPKRVLWIIPNFRTSPILVPYVPLTPREKFRIATLDSFDRGTVALGLLFGAEAQLTRADPSFGDGLGAYAHYAAAAYADYAIGDYMTEAVFPIMLHQDPRYFRRGVGSAWSRLGYAMGQILWTHTDSGRGQLNFSEILGNSTAVAISMSYYPENRDVISGVSELGAQLGVDMASNVLKEFWPDLERRFSRRHKE